MVMMNKEQFNKHTHLKIFKLLFNISFAELESLKLINGMLHSHLSRIPDVFPRYNSPWMRIIYVSLSRYESDPEMVNIGYFEQIGLENVIRSELENVGEFFSELEDELKTTSVNSFKFAYRMGLDLDMD